MWNTPTPVLSLLPTAACEQCSAPTQCTEISFWNHILVRTWGLWENRLLSCFIPRLAAREVLRTEQGSLIFLQSCFCRASCAEMQGEKRRICLKTALGSNEGSLYGGTSSAGPQLPKGRHRHFTSICKMRLKTPSQPNSCKATELCPCKGFWAMACTRHLRQLCCHVKSHQPTWDLTRHIQSNISAIRSLN